MSTKKSLTILTILIIIICGLYLFTNYISVKNNNNQDNINIPITPSPLTITGKYVCLPHKNTSGPQTMECAFGLKSDDGLYYGLDFNKLPDSMHNPSMEEHLIFSGTFTPISYLSSDHFNIYDIVGILSVDNIEKVKTPINSSNTLNTKYITSTDWPPSVKIKDGSLECNAKSKNISSRKYCVTEESEGAAGSIYITYTYSTESKNKIYSITFTLRSSQCGNYDEPQRSACEKERELFNVDILADKIIQDSIKLKQI